MFLIIFQVQIANQLLLFFGQTPDVPDVSSVADEHIRFTKTLEVQLQQESAASAKKAEKALDFEDGWGVPPYIRGVYGH
jgi:hypothetical protein